MVELLDRIKQLQCKMVEKEIDAAILLYSRDILYYANTARPCNLLITQDNATLFVRRAYEFVEKETWISKENLVKGGNFAQIKQELENAGIKKGTIGLELDVIPTKFYLNLKKTLADFNFVDISPLILEQRMIKDEREIKYLRKSCEQVEKAQAKAREVIRKGMTELELATEVEAELRRNGHEGHIYYRRFDAFLHYGTLSSGNNLYKITGFAFVVTGVGLSHAFPHGASNRVIKKGDLIVIDLGGFHRGYYSDHARTYVVREVNKKQLEVFRELKEIREEILSNLREGIASDELYIKALKKARETKYGEYFQGYGENKGEFIGHGLGLEMDEPPVISPREKIALKANMTITVELNTIIPRWGAVKLEDTLLVKKDGYELLTKTDPELFIVG
ncbi:MAG: Xaa-Pro peptidase family protein [Methanocellales archaeon]